MRSASRFALRNARPDIGGATGLTPSRESVGATMPVPGPPVGAGGARAMGQPPESTLVFGGVLGQRSAASGT
ncbi:MAG: hypothetical protein ACREMO_13195, partial [Gemmatimonadales bacterium]